MTNLEDIDMTNLANFFGQYFATMMIENNENYVCFAQIIELCFERFAVYKEIFSFVDRGNCIILKESFFFFVLFCFVFVFKYNRQKNVINF